MLPRILAIVLVASCGGGGGGSPPADACWPLTGTPGGQVELGTGSGFFEPMPAILPIVMSAGQRNGPFLRVHGRIRGITPGQPPDYFDKSNPHTKVTVEIADVGLTLGTMCPSSVPYTPSSQPDTYEMVQPLTLDFGDYAVAHADGKPAHITIEVVGSDGISAMDQKDVTLRLTGP